MSNYRRLISYIYAYEGGIKGKNIGFAKLEARNGQCKISVSVKKIYVGGSDMGVFLLSGDTELKLGSIFVRNGIGEFRTIVNTNDIENSGVNLESCYGLSIHEVENAWRAYTTIWEDAVAHAAEIELADAVSSKQAPQEEVTPVSVAMEIEKEMQQEVRFEKSDEPEADLQSEVNAQSEPQMEPKAELETEPELEPEAEPEIQMEEDTERVTLADTAGDWQADGIYQYSQEESKPSPLENPRRLAELDQMEAESEEHRRIWDFFKNQHAKIQAFDYQHGCEVLTIKPQDIGMLPRESWVYGNNSFLLHGYYNYRYLILARLENPQGRPRFLLGVPGHYYSNEKYMASMFGFPDFVLAKKQPSEDGRFGYWYTDVPVED